MPSDRPVTVITTGTFQLPGVKIIDDCDRPPALVSLTVSGIVTALVGADAKVTLIVALPPFSSVVKSLRGTTMPAPLIFAARK